MPKYWAKVRRDIVESVRMAELLRRGPLAYSLYMNAKAVSDDYGRLPSAPAKFNAKVAPMSRISTKQVAAALDLMAEGLEAGAVISRYTVNGDDYLEIIGYHTIEETDWRTVGRPEYPHPEDWQPPPELVSVLLNTGDKRITPARYGLSDTDLQKWAEYYGLLPNSARATVGRRSGDGRASILEGEGEGEGEGGGGVGVSSLPSPPPQETPPNDSETTLSETDDHDVSDGVAALAKVKNEKALRDAERLRHLTERWDTSLAALTPTDRALLDRMLAGQAEKKGKPLTLLQQLTQAELYAKELAEHGPDCWRECCEIACSIAKQVYTAEYARGCTKNWESRLADGQPAEQREEWETRLIARRKREEAERKAAGK